jgi:hypothetical protein
MLLLHVGSSSLRCRGCVLFSIARWSVLRSSVVFLIESTTGKFRDGRVVLCACILRVFIAHGACVLDGMFLASYAGDLHCLYSSVVVPRLPG